MGITMTATGAFRETGASFFFIPKGALTHHLRSRRWYPSLRSGSCALRGGCGSCGSLQTMPHHLRVLRSSSAVLKVGWFKMNQNTSAPCVNLPPAALSQLWTALTARPFSCKVKPQARPVVLESLSDEADIKTSFCYNRNAAANCIQKSKRRDIQKCL